MRFLQCRVGMRVRWRRKTSNHGWGVITGIWHDGRYGCIEVTERGRSPRIRYYETRPVYLEPLDERENAMHDKAEAYDH